MLPPWGFMWTLAIAVYAGCKSTTWLGPRVPQAPLWKQAAYLLGWPGMDAVSFLGHPKISTRSACYSSEWRASTATLVFGATLLFAVARLIPREHEYLIGWTGMIGIVLVLHFGLFRLLSCYWRSLGIEARPVMNRPLASTSLSEFWGRRWNTAFRDLSHRFLFRPFTAWFGPRFGLFAGFLFSGAIHDLVISVPARGGYGGPTAYFAIQGMAIIFERSALGRRMGLGRGGLGRAFTFFVLAAPVFLLFHPPFVVRHCAIHACYRSVVMHHSLTQLIFLAGLAQVTILFASAIVPFRLNWRDELRGLPRLHRQMHWVYGGYVVLSIIAFASLSIFNASEIASGSGLARGFCAYVAVFWGIRLALQAVFDIEGYLNTWWAKAGYSALTLLFSALTIVYSWAALHQGRF